MSNGAQLCPPDLSGSLRVIDNGFALHLANGRPTTLCGRRADPRDAFPPDAGQRVWAAQLDRRCACCERRGSS